MMDYEEKIPQYALVPAKAPNQYEFVEVKGIYSSLNVSGFVCQECKEFYIEEDILVPDVKPDLKEIVLISGAVCSKSELTLQVVYKPERKGELPQLISMATKIPFETKFEQENAKLAKDAELKLEIEKIEFMVINERKFRVKISMKGHVCEQSKEQFEAFEGIQDEPIQLKKDKIEITDLAMKKQDSLAIDEVVPIKDLGGRPCEILEQSICIIPGYKQITAEKVVLNGFICMNMLVSVIDDEENQGYEQLQSKLEFTQFIPIDARGSWSGSNISFDKSQLAAEILHEEGEEAQIRVRGNIIADVELYENCEKEVVSDAYHMKDDLQFKKEKISYKTLIGNGACDVSCREIINFQEMGLAVSEVIFTDAKPQCMESQALAGKVKASGKIAVCVLCADDAGECHAINIQIPLNAMVDVPGAGEGDDVICSVCLKDVWAEKINNSQIEFNCTATLSVQVMEKREVSILKEPVLVKGEKADKGAMTVYVARQDDLLWEIAKRYKTTVDSLMEINELEEERMKEGQKILIVR